MAEIMRIHPLEDQQFATNSLLIKPAPALKRLSLRAGSKQLKAINQVLSKNKKMRLPVKPKTSTSAGKRLALWLGPDEWLLLDEATSNLNELASDLGDTLCSVVDISHRNTAIILTGTSAANVINAGCPQDLSLEKFPVGACSRTVLGKAEIIILRTAENVFHIECWRSFSDYVWKYLVDGAKTV